MSRRLLLSASPGECRAALVEDGALADFRLVRLTGGSRIGEIHLGRVMRRLPAIRAALIDIGLERPAYLSLDEAIPKGGAALHEGASVLVQIKRDARADKAAGLAMRLRLKGRHLDWTPLNPGPRLDAVAAADRARLSLVLERQLREGEGAAARAGAAAASVSEIESEIVVLRARWSELDLKRRAAEPPCRLARVEPMDDLFDDFLDASVETVVVDDAALFAELRQRFRRSRPELLDRLQRHRAPPELFEAQGVADAIAALTASRVSLPGGASLAIVPTPAAVLVDVDSGALPEAQALGEDGLLSANMVAAKTIARQIRLRDLAGAFVVDFIPLSRRADRERLMDAFRAVLADEVRDAQLLGWTRLGHVELTRPRGRAALHEVQFAITPDGRWVKQPITVALEALAEARRRGLSGAGDKLRIRAHPQVAAVLGQEAVDAVKALEGQLGRSLEIVADPALRRDDFAIEPD